MKLAQMTTSRGLLGLASTLTEMQRFSRILLRGNYPMRTAWAIKKPCLVDACSIYLLARASLTQ